MPHYEYGKQERFVYPAKGVYSKDQQWRHNSTSCSKSNFCDFIYYLNDNIHRHRPRRREIKTQSSSLETPESLWQSPSWAWRYRESEWDLEEQQVDRVCLLAPGAGGWGRGRGGPASDSGEARQVLRVGHQPRVQAQPAARHPGRQGGLPTDCQPRGEVLWKVSMPQLCWCWPEGGDSWWSEESEGWSHPSINRSLTQSEPRSWRQEIVRAIGQLPDTCDTKCRETEIKQTSCFIASLPAIWCYQFKTIPLLYLAK